MFLRNAAEQHWEQMLPEHNTPYIQMNQLTNEPNETLEQYGLRIRRLLNEQKPKNLIVDLRHNNCGATLLYGEIEAISSLSRRRPIRKKGRTGFIAGRDRGRNLVA
jgi:hypothetical protein